MKEYGGYIELDTYRLPMFHGGALALNCGRNCLAYLIKARNIRKIKVPFFMCDSVFDVCKRYGAEISFYNVDVHFKPLEVCLADDEWLYVMNYYGQLTTDYLTNLKLKYDRLIVDNAQAYFDVPVANTDTLYTCRKYFGVSDGAFLYTNARINDELTVDESFERMHYLLGRYERTASEFYSEYVDNNHLFASEPIKRMSKLTDNFLHGIDYNYVKERRTNNFRSYHEKLKTINQLDLREVEGAFAYPLLLENGLELRKALQKVKIYIPTLWPNVINETAEDSNEHFMAQNILPLPCDQRYTLVDIEYICEVLRDV